MDIDAIEKVFDEIVEEPPVSDPESMEALLRLRNQFDAYVTVAFCHFALQEALRPLSARSVPDPVRGVTPSWWNC